MKIGDKNGVDHCAHTARVRAEATRPGWASAAARKISMDSVQVSGVARALSKLIGHVDTEVPDPARSAQVAILRNAVASGRYQPDLLGVAQKLLAEVAAEIAG